MLLTNFSCHPFPHFDIWGWGYRLLESMLFSSNIMHLYCGHLSEFGSLGCLTSGMWHNLWLLGKSHIPHDPSNGFRRASYYLFGPSTYKLKLLGWYMYLTVTWVHTFSNWLLVPSHATKWLVLVQQEKVICFSFSSLYIIFKNVKVNEGF